MGYDNMIYRPQYEWFNLDDIESGENQRWSELVAINPSLSNTINISKTIRDGYIEKFMDRYSVSSDQVKNFYNVLFGYHPKYGGYTLCVGPYIGPKPEDDENVFSSFEMRHKTTNSENLLESLREFLYNHKALRRIAQDLGVVDPESEKGTPSVSGLVSPEDFTFTLQERVTSNRWAKEEPHEVTEVIDLTPDFLQKNSYEFAEGNDLDVPHRPLMGQECYFQMKPSGVFKILMRVAQKYGQEDDLQAMIEGMANERNVWDEDDIINLLYNDSSFYNEVVKAFSEINPIVDGITEPKRSGSQGTSALRPSKEAKRSLLLMKEICEEIESLNTTDPTVLADALNANRPKKRGKAEGTFTPEIVSKWMEQIEYFQKDHGNDGDVERMKSYKELIGEFSSALDKNQLGFNDMETAIKMASLRYSEGDGKSVDPKTKARLNPSPSAFDIPLNANTTSDDLKEMRLGEGIVDKELEENQDETTEEVLPEAQGDGLEEGEIEIDPARNEPSTPEVVEEENSEVINLQDKAIANSLKSLQKIANDLRESGKGKVAWNLEYIIRKHKKGLTHDS